MNYTHIYMYLTIFIIQSDIKTKIGSSKFVMIQRNSQNSNSVYGTRRSSQSRSRSVMKEISVQNGCSQNFADTTNLTSRVLNAGTTLKSNLGSRTDREVAGDTFILDSENRKRCQEETTVA